jgi:hypothetical protein
MCRPQGRYRKRSCETCVAMENPGGSLREHPEHQYSFYPATNLVLAVTVA